MEADIRRPVGSRGAIRDVVRPVKSVLVLNCGSSSLKFQVLQVTPTGDVVARPARGGLSGFGPTARVRLETTGRPIEHSPENVPDHRTAADRILDWVAGTRLHIDAVAHRVVHGGPTYGASALIDDRVLDGLDALAALAPLHNRPSIEVIRATRARLGATVPMVAVFDTAFHAGLPDVAREYAIPRSLAHRHAIRRYGFHGTSFRGVVEDYARLVGRPPSTVRIVALHLGSGCSAAAIADGRSVDTSMGFTPLEGLIMGIFGKRMLWRSLEMANVLNTSKWDFEHLERRAEDQIQRAEAERIQAAQRAFVRGRSQD